MKIRRISASSAQETRNDQFLIRRIHYNQYAVCTAVHQPVLALEAWARRVDIRMADMSQPGYDDHRLVHDLLVQQAALQRELQEIRGRVTALE
ncbi:hypothetical protein Tco_1380509 [Tanacetum coccineum]